MMSARRAAAVALFVSVSALAPLFPTAARAQTAPAVARAVMREVVVVSRHGVRSPTDPNELAPYSARPWPSWEVAPGYLTPHGAAAIVLAGKAYRARYAAAGLLPATGCPTPGSIFVWADVDQRTKETARSLLEGLAPGCGFVAQDAGSQIDPLFHALPALGKADPATALAALSGALGDATAIVPAYGLAFAKLDAILGCGGAHCQVASRVPAGLRASAKSGLASLEGAPDIASTAVEDFILAYTDGKPSSEVGWGEVDRKTLLELSQLHVLKSSLVTQTPYVARVQGSNLLAHVAATIDLGATGVPSKNTRVPATARFAAFVGHDTNLGELAGMLQLRWFLPGYQLNDTPPGGALVFEVYGASGGAEPFVRTFFSAQSLDDMRTLASRPPDRAAVFVPGCPALDCPLATFDRVVAASIDRAYVGSW
jgi:4-phytase/acid phosphatase